MLGKRRGTFVTRVIVIGEQRVHQFQEFGPEW
jgi:hypothetical protein